VKKKPPAPSSLAAQIAGLADASWSDLKAHWQQLFEATPLPGNRRFVEKRIAHQWQEIAYRKVEPTRLQRNAKRIDTMLAAGSVKRQRTGAVPVPGTVLVRHYDGIEHQVTIAADMSFEYEGRPYASLSVIAREITGTRWSGPAFFGLRKAAAR
jgi:hypothetical protein